MIRKSGLFPARERLDFTALFLAATAGLLVMMYYYSAYLNVPLTNFSDRSIGITVMAGIDANLRTLLYCTAVVVSLVIMAATYFALSYTGAYLFGRPGGGAFVVERKSLLYLSAFALFTAAYAIVRNDEGLMALSRAILLVSGFFFTLAILRKYLILSRPGAAVYLQDQTLVLFATVFSFSLLYAAWAISGRPLEITAGFLIFMLLVALVLTTALPFVFLSLGLTIRRCSPALQGAVIPLALLPAALPLFNELAFSLSGPSGSHARAFGVTVVAGLYAASILLFMAGLAGRFRFSTSGLVKNYVFPALIAGFFLSSAVSGELLFESFDLFHNGERMLMTQQLFQQGRMPFVDILPTHGLMDFFGQSIYTLANGYRGPEMFHWRWIAVLAGIFLFYFAVTRFMAPGFVFLLILLTPESFAFNDYYRFALVVPLVLIWVARRPDFRRYLFLWFTIVLLFFWRYDFGVIALIATLCLVPGLGIQPGVSALPKRLLQAFKNPLLAGAVMFPAAILLYAGIVWLNGEDPFWLFRQFYYYFKTQAPTQSVIPVFEKQTTLVLLEYVFSPAIASAYLLHYLYTVFVRRVSPAPFRLLLAWIAVFSLVMTLRTVQRHTLAEGFNPVLSIFLAAAAPYYFYRPRKNRNDLIYLSVLFLFALVLSGFQRLYFVKQNPVSLLNSERLYSVFDQSKGDDRVIISDSSQFRNFRRFLDKTLTKEQTFFDFSNAPLLYVLTDRMFPAHLIPNLYQAADPVQEGVIKRLEAIRTAGRLPLVLFRQNTYWDSIDGVPQPVRSYRVSEYIYRHYDPYCLVDQYEVWMEKGRDLPAVLSGQVSPGFRKQEGTRLSDAGLLGLDADSILLATQGPDPHIFGIIDRDQPVVLEPGGSYALVLRFTCDKPGKLQVFFSTDGSAFTERLSSTVKVGKAGGIQERRIRLPRVDKETRLSDLRFDPPADASFCLYRPVISQADAVPISRTAPQHFDLKRLPAVWARYDDKKASETTAVLSNLLKEPRSLEPDEKFETSWQGNLDKSSGNYLHLVVSSAGSGKMTISCGAEPGSSVQFDLDPGQELPYLVRISSLRAWMTDGTNALTIQTTAPVTIHRVMIRKGD